MTKRRALGKGLEALIPVSQEPPTGLTEVPVSAIHANPMQPRSTIDPETLAELAASISEHGLIQPLVVTQQGPDNYQLIAGERRWQAARMSGLTLVPVVIKEASPQQILELALVENIQRADLNPLEEAAAFRQLVDDFGLTQEQVAERVGKSRVTITNTLRLLRLPEKVQQALTDGAIHEGHARALLSLPQVEAQLAALRTIVNKDLNVRQTEELVRRLKAKPKPKKAAPKASPQIEALEKEFRESLGTRVDLHRNRKGHGKVVIHFYSEEELQSIYDVVVGSD